MFTTGRFAFQPAVRRAALAARHVPCRAADTQIRHPSPVTARRAFAAAMAKRMIALRSKAPDTRRGQKRADACARLKARSANVRCRNAACRSPGAKWMRSARISRMAAVQETNRCHIDCTHLEKHRYICAMFSSRCQSKKVMLRKNGNFSGTVSRGKGPSGMDARSPR